MKYKLFKSALIFSLLVQSLAFQVSLPNIVLCFGEDGHVAFELQGEDRLCEHDEAPYHQLSGHAHSDLSGVDCTDIDLLSICLFADPVRKKNLLPGLSFCLGPASSGKFHFQTYSKEKSVSQNSSLDPGLESVRKTVLLI